MAHDRPVGSVSGTRDWAWNRWQADVAAARERDRRSHGDAPSERSAGLPRPDRTDRLETRLERQEHRTQTIIDRYEHLLEERERALDAATAAPGGRWARLRAALGRLTPG